MTAVSAARHRLPSPVGHALAGFSRRAGRDVRCDAEDDPLEINAAGFSDGSRAVVLIAIDALVAGPVLAAAAERAARTTFGEGAVALVAASHTHFAPATDPTKPALGACSPAYVEQACAALELIVGELRPMHSGVTLGLGSRAVPGNVHRRRRWILPTLLWWVQRRADLVAIAPNPKGPCDPQVRVAVLRRPDGAPLAVVWNYACHPVFYPRDTAATAEFAGYVRRAVRMHFGDEDLPVIFLQGFAGDVCPDVRPEPSLRTMAETLALGPRWGRFTQRTWDEWADGIAHGVVAAIEDARSRALDGALGIARRAIPLSEVVEGDLPQKVLQVDRLAIGNDWRLVALSAEPSTAYAGLLCPDGAWPVSCVGDVFGYLPTEAQRRMGGYEVSGYFSALGIKARLHPGGEARVVEACRTMLAEKT
jgi:hypothetical protein